MRVRYQMVGMPQSIAKCDLEDKKAKRLYKDLFGNGRCEWAELVGEDDDNYMDVLESFDHTMIARTFAELFGMGG